MLTYARMHSLGALRPGRIELIATNRRKIQRYRKVLEKANDAFSQGAKRVTLRRFRSVMIYFDSRRSFNPDLRSLMRRKRRSSGGRNFTGHQMSRATVKSSFRHAFTHPPLQHVRILYKCRCRRWDDLAAAPVTTSLAAASHEKAGLGPSSRRAAVAITPPTATRLEDGIVLDRKIRTRTSARDILKGLPVLRFSSERSCNIYNPSIVPRLSKPSKRELISRRVFSS